MDFSLAKACEVLGLPPHTWMIRNPFKIYEFREVVRGSGLAKTHAVLDLGCGKGHWTQMLAFRSKSVLGLDIKPLAIEIANRRLRRSPVKGRVRFRCRSLAEAALPEASFDRVFSFCVLEHIEDLPQVLSEVHRVLKPGGELHASVDSLGTVQDPELVRRHQRANSVAQYFTRGSLRDRLESAGFEVKTIFPILTGKVARREFEQRIVRSYKKNLLDRIRLVRQFQDEDRQRGEHGIMLIGRGRKRSRQ